MTPGNVYPRGKAIDLLYEALPHGPGHDCPTCKRLDMGRAKLAAAIAGWAVESALPPVDFGVSMRADVLEHKRRDGRREDGAYCYWTFSQGTPVGVIMGSRMWVANRGRWVGYFEILNPDFIPHGAPLPDWGTEVPFFSESFVMEDGGPRLPFMGYTLKVPERK